MVNIDRIVAARNEYCAGLELEVDCGGSKESKCYLIEDKMFAAVCYDDQNRDVYITLKLNPAEGDFLRQQFEDIIPGYYMNKVHWNSVRTDGAVPDDLLKEMLDKSYALVLSGFSKKKQQEILSK